MFQNPLRAGAKDAGSPNPARRRLTALALAVATVGPWAHAPARAEAFPTHPLRMIVAYAPGGATDIVGRMFAQEMSETLGQTVVLENRAGGGTLVGTESVKRSAPDGYTLLFGTNAFVITPLLHDTKTYDPLTDFQPVGQTTVQSLGILVTPGLKIRTVKDFIAYAKANPGKVNFASSGNGSAQHLAGEAFAKAAGIEMVHVPYKGTGPAMADLLAGRVDVMFSSLVGNMEHVTEGRLNLIATTGLKRSPATPEVPTVDESGLKGFQAETWQAVMAPAGTPAAVVERLNAALVQAGKSPKIVQTLAAQGMEVRISSPAELRELLARDTKQYQTLLKQAKNTLQ
ncbi:MAG: tripartite tricarboxylate transporter substrate binding protein [Pigmentiphaga sp.]|uniref:Bug family tripartite tricarboxylate transporter substrate binding protein n=1 Tax=Pigmentiphaga sp. TaxID=1977564 RepID=UPI0029A58160|nr:tripartite tricarboxylate transporter substrate binding protein [Pigmentiphaga sp.]MDX3906343.1 tripartite tricarboxylate transporter substrate binding protein [Pigmentiphaga sp.]